MTYKDCKILCKLTKQDTPLISTVPCDEFTNIAQLNFDYEFNGQSKFYPYKLPNELLNIDFNIMVICGSSGKGKSTLLKEFEKNKKYTYMNNRYDNSKAIISCFTEPNEASKKLSAVGLNSIPVWCRPRNVLSVGEGFRADIALNLESYNIFDEFTSTIDRNVAKGCCNGIQKYIRKNNLTNMIFCSCHNDYIPFLKPDIVVDLDEENVYDCRGIELGEALSSKCMNMKEIKNTFGGLSNTIII